MVDNKDTDDPEDYFEDYFEDYVDSLIDPQNPHLEPWMTSQCSVELGSIFLNQKILQIGFNLPTITSQKDFGSIGGKAPGQRQNWPALNFGKRTIIVQRIYTCSVNRTGIGG